jgi:hypothetical protein
MVWWKLLKRNYDRLPGALAFAALGWLGTYWPLPPENELVRANDSTRVANEF